LITLGFIAFGINYYLKIFAKQFNSNPRAVVSQIKQGLTHPFDQDRLTILLLGLDQRPDNPTMLTDTMLIIDINAKTGNWLLFSLPRDLWLPKLQTKINALYYYGQKQNPQEKTKLVEQEIEELINQTIDHTIILKMETIKDLIDLLGGIEINVEKGFIDNQFPKDDGTGEVMTIEFETGKQTMNGETALQFIRSRKSADLDEGTDDARQKRQKQVIMALKNKLINNRFALFSPSKLGQLYNFIQQNLDISPKIDLVRLASFYQLAPKIISGQETELQLPYQDKNAVLMVSKDPIYNTWILLPKNNDWSAIADYYQSHLP